MSKFEAKISVALNPDSISNLVDSIQKALSGQTISLDGVKITAGSVDVSSVVNSIQQQIQDSLKNININANVGGGISVDTNTSIDKRTSSGSNRDIVTGTKSGKTGKERVSSTDIGVGTVTSKKINNVLNEKNLALNQVRTSNKLIEANRILLEQDGLTKREIDKINDAIKTAEKSAAEGYRKVVELDKQYTDLKKKRTAQREKDERILERKSAVQTVNNARENIPALQYEISSQEKQIAELQKKIDYENDESRLASYKSQEADVSSKIAEKEKLLPEVRKRISEQKAYISSLEKEKAKIADIARDENKHRKWSSDISAQIKKKNQEIAAISDSEPVLKAEIAVLEEKGASIQAIIGSGEKTRGVKSYMKQYADIASQTREKKQELEAIPKKIADIKKEVGALEGTRSDLQKQIILNRNGKSAQELRSHYTDLSSEAEKENVRLSNMLKEEFDLENEIGNLGKRRAEIRKNIQYETDTSRVESYKRQQEELNYQRKKNKDVLAKTQENASDLIKKYKIKSKAEDEQLFAQLTPTHESSTSGNLNSDWKANIIEKERQAGQARQASKAQDGYNKALEELDKKRQRFVETADLRSSEINRLQKKLYTLDKSSETYSQEAKDTRALIRENEALRDNAIKNSKDTKREINQLKIQKASGTFDASGSEAVPETTTEAKQRQEAAKQQQNTAKQQKAVAEQTRATEKQTHATTEQTHAITDQTQAAATQKQSEKKEKQAESKQKQQTKNNQSVSSAQTSKNPPSDSNQDYQKKAADYLTKIYNQQNKNGKIQSEETNKNTEALEGYIPKLEAIKNGKPGETGWLQKGEEDDLKKLLSLGKSGTARLRLKNITDTQYRNLEENFERLKNTEYYKKHKSKVDDGMKKLSPDMSAKDYQEANANLTHYNAEAERLNQTGKSFLSRLKDQYDTFLKYTVVAEAFMYIRQAMQEMVTSVKEVDAAMTELKKVTDLSDSGYTQALERAKTTAKEVGASVSDTVNATADFARLGYNVEDASELAKVALIYKNVGDGIENISQASESIISTMQAFGIEAKDAMSIVDKFNEVGNNYAISSTGIGTAMEKSAAALAVGGNTIDESIALITAANKVVQNPEVVGTALKTYSMYLRAAKTEAEEAGEETEGMAHSVSELRDEILLLTGGRVDTMANATTPKSTYQFTKELSEVWDSLADIDRANILELIGGKRNANTLAGLITNFAEAQKVLETSLNSSGSAMKENEKYLDSIAGKTERLKATFQDFSTSFLNSNLFKALLDSGNVVLEVIDGIVDKIGSIPLAINGVMAAISIGSIASQIKEIGGIGKTIDKVKSVYQSATDAGESGIGAVLGKVNSSGLLKAAAAISIITTAVGVAVNAVKNINEKIEKQQADAAKAAEEYEKTIASLDGYKEQYLSIKKDLQTPGISDDMATSKRAKLVEIERQIAEAFGEQAANIDLINGAIESQISAIDKLGEDSFSNFKNENSSAIGRAEDYLSDLSGRSVWSRTFGPLAGMLTGDIMGFSGLGYNFQNPFKQRVIDEFEKRYGKSVSTLTNTQFLNNMATVGVPVKDAYEMQEYLNGLMDITETLGREEYGGGYREKVGGMLDAFSDQLGKVNEVIEKNEKIYEDYAKGELSTNKEYKQKWSDLLAARNEYEEAVISGNEEQQEELYERVIKMQSAFGVAGITDKSVSTYLSRFFDQFEKEEVVTGAKIKIRSDLSNQRSHLNDLLDNTLTHFLDEEGRIDDTLLKHGEILYETGSASADAKAYERLASAAGNYKIEVEQLISILKDFGAVQGSAFDEAYKTARTNFEEITKNIHDAYMGSGFSNLTPYLYTEQKVPEKTDAVAGFKSAAESKPAAESKITDDSKRIQLKEARIENMTGEQVTITEAKGSAGNKSITEKISDTIKDFNANVPTVNDIVSWVGEAAKWVGEEVKQLGEKLRTPSKDSVTLPEATSGLFDTISDFVKTAETTGKVSDYIKRLSSGVVTGKQQSGMPTVEDVAKFLKEQKTSVDNFLDRNRIDITDKSPGEIVIEEISKWFGDKAVPAIDSFREKVQEFIKNPPSFQEISDLVGDTLKSFGEKTVSAFDWLEKTRKEINAKIPTVSDAINWVGEKLNITDGGSTVWPGQTTTIELYQKLSGMVTEMQSTAKITDSVSDYLKRLSSGVVKSEDLVEIRYDLGDGNLLTREQIEESAKQAGQTVDEFVRQAEINNNINRLKDTFYGLAKAAGYFNDETDNFTDLTGHAEDVVDFLASAYDSFAAQAEGVTNAEAAIKSAMAEQQEAGTISKETFESLSQLGQDYSDIFDWDGRGLKINLDAFEKVNKDLRNITSMETEALQGEALKVWKENAAIIGQQSGKYQSLSDVEKQSLDALIKNNRSVTEQITGYQILLSQLDFANSGYKKWLDSGSKVDSDKMYSDVLNANQAIKNVFGYTDKNSGEWVAGNEKINSIAFNAATEFLVPEKIRSQGTGAIKTYVSGIQEYLNDDKKSVEKFLSDAEGKGLVEKNGDTWQVKDGITSDQVADDLNITKDLLTSIVGDADTYGIELTFDEHKQILALNDAQDYFEALNDYNKAYQNYIDVKNKVEPDAVADGKQTKKQIAEVTKAEKELAAAAKKKDTAFEKLNGYSEATLGNVGVEFEEGQTKEQAVEKWLNGSNRKQEVKLKLTAEPEKGDIQQAVENYREAVQAVQEDPTDSDAAAAAQQIEAQLSSLPKSVQIAVGIDTSLFEYGIASVSETVKDLASAHAEYQLLVDTGAAQSDIDAAKAKIEELTTLLNSLPEEVKISYGFTTENGLLNEDGSINTDNLFKGLEDGTFTLDMFKLGPGDSSGIEGVLHTLEQIQGEVDKIREAGDLVLVSDVFVDETLGKISEVKHALEELGSGENGTGSVVLMVDLFVEEFNAKVSEINHALNELQSVGNGTSSIVVNVDLFVDEFNAKVSEITTALSELQSIGNATGTIVITTDLFIDESMARIGDLKISLDEIGNGEHNITVTANTEQAIASITGLIGQLSEIEREYTATVIANIGQAMVSLAGLAGQLNNISREYTATVTANVSQALSAIASVQSSLAGLQNKTVTVTVNTVKAGEPKVNGSAFAGGSWGVKRGGVSLVGELGRELIVNPDDGTWYTVGDHGAEFAPVPQGAIVFNHKQTESLLKYGKVAGRGRALANGTSDYSKSILFDGEKYSKLITLEGEEYAKSISLDVNLETKEYKPDEIVRFGGYYGYRYNGEGNQDDLGKFASDVEDLVEIFFDRLERRIDKIDNVLSSAFKKIETRSEASYDKIELLTKQLADKQKAAEIYRTAAESINLSDDIKEALRDGDLRIENLRGTVDNGGTGAYLTTKEKQITTESGALISMKQPDADAEAESVFNDNVSKYQEYYEKYLDTLDDIEEIKEDIADTLIDRFENIKTDFDNQISLVEHEASIYTTELEQLQNKGYKAETKHYDALNEIEKKRYDLLSDKLDTLRKEYDAAMASGEIEYGSEAWYDLINAINETEEAMQEVNSRMIEYTNNARELIWEAFDGRQERIDLLIDQNEFLMNLIDDSNVFDKDGKITQKGVSYIAVSLDSLRKNLRIAKNYGDELERINEELLKDPNNKILSDRAKELRENQQQYILAAKKSADVINDIELKSLKGLIDNYEDALDRQKDERSYQRDIKKKTDEIADIRKQIAAYTNDTSEDAVRRVQELQKKLRETEEGLEDTQYDRYIDMQKEMLEDLYDEYEEVINRRFDDVSSMIKEVSDGLIDSAGEIAQTLNLIAQNVGYVTHDDILPGDIDLDGLITPEDARLAMRASVGLEKLLPQQIKNGDLSGDGTIDPGDARLIMRIATKIETIEQYLQALGIVGYSGGGLVNKTGIAMLHGTASDPEIVLDANDSKNLLGLRDTMREMTRMDLSLLGTPYSARYGRDACAPSIGEIQINIPIDRVDDYNDFIDKMKSDDRFGKMIRAASVDLLNGSNSMRVYHI